MKKIVLFLMAVMLGMAVSNAQGTGTFVVADGSSTNSFVPVYGYYADSYLRCQTIYPADMLTEIAGSEIQGVTYYLDSPAEDSWGDASFVVKIGTVSASDFGGDEPAWINTDAFTTVYTGRLDASQPELTIMFSAPFAYSGGNLLIEILNTAEGDYVDASFIGIEVEHASVQGYSYSAVDDIEADWQDFIPKTGFIIPVSCVAPSIGNIDVTETSATVSWTENGSATSWQYMIGDGDWTASASPSCTVNGLSSNTAYSVSVRAVCGPDNVSFPVTSAFRTSCPASVALPYAENFESYTAGSSSFPACWSSVSGASYVQAYAGNNSNKALRFEESAVVATPVVNVAGNSLLISFDLMSEYSYYAGSMAVGFATSPDAVESAIYLDTIQPDEEYNNYEYSFENTLNIQSGCLVFKQLDDEPTYWMAYGLFLDNLSISVLSDCRRPESLSIIDISPNSATLSWSAAALSSAYEVAIATANDVEHPDSIVSVTSNSVTFSNLSQATTYYAWVRTVCGEERTLWRAASPFTTEVACAALTNVQVLSSAMTAIAIGWSVDASVGYPSTSVIVSYKASDATEYVDSVVTGSNIVLTGLQPGYSYNVRLRNICSDDTADVVSLNVSTVACSEIGNGSASSGSLPTNTNYNYSYTQSIYPSDEVGNIDTIRGISYNFASSGTTTRTVDVYIADIENASLADGFIDISLFTRVVAGYSWNLGNGWCSIPFSQPFVHQQGKDLVIAMDDNTGSYQYYYFTAHSGTSRTSYDDDTNFDPITPPTGNASSYAPDIRFDVTCDPSCPAPIVLVNDVATHEVSLVWTPLGDETSWSVEYKPSADSVWTVFSNNLATPACIVTGLESATSYRFRVAAICGDNPSFATVAAFTDCDAKDMPFHDGFEEYVPDVFPQCWSNISETSNFVDDYASNVSVGTQSLHLQGPALVASPIINFNGDDVYVHFDLMSEDDVSGSMAIGIAASPGDIANALWVDTIVPSDYSFHNYELIVPNPDQLQSGCILFKQISTYSNYYYWLDELYVSVPPTCFRPTNLSVDEVTASSAVISWSHDAQDFQISYRTADGEWQLASSTTPSVTLNGLDASSLYQFEVRAICSENDTSEALSGSFRTLCSVLSADALPYFEGFEDGLGCWSQQQIQGSLEWTTSNYYYNAYEGNSYVSLTSDSYDMETRLISPLFDLSNLENVTLRFVHVQEDYYDDQDALSVEYRLSPSDEWHQLAYYTSSIADWQSETIVLPEVSSTFQIAFHGYAEWGHGIGIDSLSLSADIPEIPVCNVPSNVTVSNLTANTVTVSWIGSAAQYEVQVSGGAQPITQTVSADSYTFQTLSPETDYSVQVRAICDNGLTSDWSVAVSFSTPQPECDVPVNVQTSTTATSVTVSWIGYASEYDVLVSGGDMPIQRTVYTNSCTIDGLAPASTYNVKVRAKCDGQYTDWTDALTFYTADGNAIDDLSAADFSVSLYPNPATNRTTVCVNGLTGSASLNVIDMSGRTLLSTSMVNGTALLNVSHLASGTYFVRIYGDNFSTVRKLVVK